MAVFPPFPYFQSERQDRISNLFPGRRLNIFYKMSEPGGLASKPALSSAGELGVQLVKRLFPHIAGNQCGRQNVNFLIQLVHF